MESCEYMLIPVPADVFDELGWKTGMTMQAYVENGKIIISQTDDTDDYICDGDCENCPHMYDCEDEYETDFDACDDCPCCCPECGASMRDQEDGNE